MAEGKAVSEAKPFGICDMSSITIEDVTKSFGAVRAVDHVSVQIEKGELFFLLGPSGCGKTTLLRMIAGFYFPETGRILFDGKDLGATPPHKRNTAMVFQNYALWPHMTVWENLEFGLEMRRVATEERRRRIERALEITQMSEYADRSPNQLSGGQQQRVALGRALALEPDVVLMDEPLSNLDAKLRLEMREQIKRIHERLNVTMVYVTHDQSEALSMADRMAVMRDGRIMQSGGPREIYNRPANRFVADFIGETNLLRGRIAETGAQTVVETGAGRLRSSAPREGMKAGDEVYCCIRPERLRVLTGGETSPNTMTGEVVRTIYLGNHEQYYLRLSDGAEIKAIEPHAEAPKAQTGKAATFGCGTEDVVLLPVEGGAQEERIEGAA